MRTEPYSNAEMNALIRDALGSNPEFIIPSKLTEKTIRRIEKRQMLREVVFELAAKIGIVTGSLAILTGVLYLTGQNQIVKEIIAFAVQYKQLIVVLLSSVLAIIFLDELVFKYITRLKNSGIDTKLSRIG
jgi:hypothetical protein